MARVEEDRPTVVLRVDEAWRDTPTLAEILAGLEEEGVPSLVEWSRGEAGRQAQPAAVAMAHQAARASRLEVGLGLDESGALVLHQRRQPEGSPLLMVPGGQVNLETARAMGMNAARLVKVQPLAIPGDTQGREAP